MKCVSFVPLLIPLVAAICLLASCGPPPKKKPPPNDEARIEREVKRRVDTIRAEMEHSQKRWRTIRVVAFCLLAGGSLIWLFHIAEAPRQPAGTNTNPSPNPPTDPPSDPRRRFIDSNQDDEHGPYENRY